jgi:hypothetical protein
MIKQISRNVHELTTDLNDFQLAVLSDIHWDNPKCDRDKLKRDLDYCVKHEIPIFINGDFFCLMQGRGDHRRNKSDIRPEHNNARYLDSIVETAVEWWTPYAHLLTVIGYGNHETGVIKYQETDILARFVDLLNYKCGTQVFTGGYGGWIVIKQRCGNDKLNTNRVKTKLKYFHGSGGGGIVTKGAINLTRALEMYEDMDVFTMGHIHENWARNDMREKLVHNSVSGYSIQQKHVHHMITGTYKDEYVDGFGGWHIERGAPVKILGGRILKINTFRAKQERLKHIDSISFPR